MDVRKLTSRIGNSSSSFLCESVMMAVTVASADIVNDDSVDLTTPLSHEMIRSWIDARELAQRAAL